MAHPNQQRRVVPVTKGGVETIRAIEKLGISAGELCRRSGVDRCRFNRLLTGRSVPALWEAVAIEDHTGVECRHWLEDID